MLTFFGIRSTVLIFGPLEGGSHPCSVAGLVREAFGMPVHTPTKPFTTRGLLQVWAHTQRTPDTNSFERRLAAEPQSNSARTGYPFPTRENLTRGIRLRLRNSANRELCSSLHIVIQICQMLFIFSCLFFVI